MPAKGATTTSDHHRFDVAVIGAGAIGLAVAWRAAQRGMRVVVLERAAIGGGASRVAAGMLAPVSEAEFGRPELLALSLESARLWPEFAGQVAAAAGSDPGYMPCGALLVARDRDEAETLERELTFRREQGLAVERLLASEARRREPALAPTLRLALALPSDHACDPRLLCSSLALAARAAGAELREHADASGVAVAGRSVVGVELADGSRVAADQVVVAAGAWSAALAGDAAMPPVRPVKGQILRLRDPAGPGLLAGIVRFEGGYLVPRRDGRYVLGATVEERGFDTSVTAGAVHDLLRDAAELVPGVLELVVEELAAGLRPATPDNAPLLGPAGAVGLHWATGHHRNGILLAPVTAHTLVASLVGEPLPAIAAPFAADRFAGVAA